MILTLEGAPAVGKSTIASRLGCRVVSEVNRLFGKPADPQKSQAWYLAKQLERWKIAAEADEAGSEVVLDGDVFQPIWFGTYFWQEDWGSLVDILDFYREAMRVGRVGIPDKFVCLTVHNQIRATREHDRCVVAGRSPAHALGKSARYEGLGPFLQEYFGAIDVAFPGLVTFLDTRQPIPATLAQLRNQAPASGVNHTDVLEFAGEWCGRYRQQAAQSLQSAA
jgi:hypothetical protein